MTSPMASFDAAALAAAIAAAVTSAMAPITAANTASNEAFSEASAALFARLAPPPALPPPTVAQALPSPAPAVSSAPLPPPVVPASSPSARPFRNPLPAEMIPTASGSDADNAQTLVRLLTTFHRRSSRYPTLRAFREALDDWMRSSAKAGWSGPELNSLMQYIQFVSVDLARWPLETIMDYHTRFLKGVHEGTIDMFAQDAHLNLGCLHYAGLLLASPPPGSGTVDHHSSDRDDDDAEDPGTDS